MGSSINQNSNPFQPAPKREPKRSHANFIEALKSVGGQTAQSISHDVVGGVTKDFIQSFTGGPSKPNQYQENPYNRETNLSPEDQIRQEILKAQRHREVVENNVFDRRKEEAKMRIRVIQDELKALAKDLAGFDDQLQKVVEEEIVNPGTYHVNFFEKIRKLVILMRQRVQESENWLIALTERSQKQQGYWGQVQKSGTKFMLSQERYMATQAG